MLSHVRFLLTVDRLVCQYDHLPSYLILLSVCLACYVTFSAIIPASIAFSSVRLVLILARRFFSITDFVICDCSKIVLLDFFFIRMKQQQ